MIEFKQWVARKAAPLLIVSWAMLTVLLSSAQAMIVKDLRTGENRGFVRLVLEFDRPLTPPPSLSVDRNRLKIALANIDNRPPKPAAIDGITQLEVFRQSGDTRIETDFAFVPADIKTFALTGPHRFIIDAYRPATLAAAPAPAGEEPHRPASTNAPAEPKPYRKSENSVSALTPGLVAHAAPEPYSRPGANIADSEAERKSRFQQRLVAALIVVTSIIAVLLFFLMRTGGVRPVHGQRSWTDQLPSTKDPDIEAIDTVIRNHLNTYDRL